MNFLSFGVHIFNFYVKSEFIKSENTRVLVKKC